MEPIAGPLPGPRSKPAQVEESNRPTIPGPSCQESDQRQKRVSRALTEGPRRTGVSTVHGGIQFKGCDASPGDFAARNWGAGGRVLTGPPWRQILASPFSGRHSQASAGAHRPGTD